MTIVSSWHNRSCRIFVPQRYDIRSWATGSCCAVCVIIINLKSEHVQQTRTRATAYTRAQCRTSTWPKGRQSMKRMSILIKNILWNDMCNSHHALLGGYCVYSTCPTGGSSCIDLGIKQNSPSYVHSPYCLSAACYQVNGLSNRAEAAMYDSLPQWYAMPCVLFREPQVGFRINRSTLGCFKTVTDYNSTHTASIMVLFVGGIDFYLHSHWLGRLGDSKYWQHANKAQSCGYTEFPLLNTLFIRKDLI